MNKIKSPLSSSLSHMIIVLVAVAGLSALILGYVYRLTEVPIRKAKDQRELEAISEVVYGDFDNNPFEEKHIIPTADGKGKVELYPARKEGNITSVAIKTYTNNAFGGKMELMVGFFVDGTINKYKIIDQKETPGLGTKVSEAKFSSQFNGLNPGKHIFKVRQDGGEIDAVTAATISSRAVIDAIQRAFDAFRKLNSSSAGN